MSASNMPIGFAKVTLCAKLPPEPIMGQPPMVRVDPHQGGGGQLPALCSRSSMRREQARHTTPRAGSRRSLRLLDLEGGRAKAAVQIKTEISLKLAGVAYSSPAVSSFAAAWASACATRHASCVFREPTTSMKSSGVCLANCTTASRPLP